MTPSRKLYEHIRSNVVGYVAVFIALSGTAYAVDGPLAGRNTVGSADIINGEVRTPDIHGGAVTAARLGSNSVRSGKILNGNVRTADLRLGAVTPSRLANDSVRSHKVLDGSLTGADVTDGGIGLADLASSSVNSSKVVLNSLSGADIADNSLSGGEIANGSINGIDVNDNGLTGADVNESTLSAPAMGCQPGLIHGFARIKGLATTPSGYTSSSTYIDTVHNCTGSSVQVRRSSAGVFFVRFTGNPSRLAMLTLGDRALDINADSMVLSYERITAGGDAGAFEVKIRDTVGSDAGDFQDRPFTIVLV